MSVLVFCENWDGKFKKSSFELVSYAGKLAEMLGSQAIVLSMGKVAENELMKLGTYGAVKIISLDKSEYDTLDNQVYTYAVAAMAEKVAADVIILANNNTGKAIAPRLSVRLKAGMGAGVTSLPLSTYPFIVRKKAFSGNAFVRLLLKSKTKVITLTQNSFGLLETAVTPQIEHADLPIEASLKKTKVQEVQKQTGKILLSDADIVVSGGRGMKSPENWAPIEELASLLGAATACSRPVSDDGWRPHEEHTGQTGKIIAPILYIAVGISGATQHLAGISSSKYIVAINTDKDAPIFSAAQYGIIGDAQKVLPKLVEAVKDMKNK